MPTTLLVSNEYYLNFNGNKNQQFCGIICICVFGKHSVQQRKTFKIDQFVYETEISKAVQLYNIIRQN